MEYAVIATGGKQYLAVPGKQLVIESLPEVEGSAVIFDQVLLHVDGETVVLGKPVIEGVSVSATIAAQQLGEKLDIMKYRGKSRYRRRMGHRQHQTVVTIDAIGGKTSSKRSTKKVEAVETAAPEEVKE